MDMTRKQMRMEVENFKNLIFERLEGRDIERAVTELIERAEDVCMDEIGMPIGWETDNEDHQMMFFEIVHEKLVQIYFTPSPKPAATIDDI